MRSALEDAFEHYAWATLRLIDACQELSAEQLQTTVPGTYGSIQQTLRHIVAGDAFDLLLLNGVRSPVVDDEGAMGLTELRAAVERQGPAWLSFLAGTPDASALVEEVDPDDGYWREGSIGIRLAQVLHHGAEHRAQVCTALTVLGLQPPDISVWEFGLESGRVRETYPPKS
ncbi:MAG TPA: DinB family protein [Dehalococcoidia bacterium]|nr:DinB family protein [Dehalococcoidia bacterium]